MLATIIEIIFSVYTIMLLVRVLGSWFPRLSQSRFMHFISFYTDPYLNLFRRLIPPFGMIDLSPMFAFIALQVIQWILLAIFS